MNLLFGLVLAGGRSSRFGSEKALARLNGVTLLETAVNRLSGLCREVAISAPAGSGAAALAGELGLTVLRDRSGDAADEGRIDRDPARRRFQADDAAPASRQADRAADISTNM